MVREERVLEFIKSDGGWVKQAQICKALKMKQCNVSEAIQDNLLMLEVRKTPGKGSGKEYRYTEKKLKHKQKCDKVYNNFVRGYQ